jgi:subtilisin family serine protease
MKAFIVALAAAGFAILGCSSGDGGAGAGGAAGTRGAGDDVFSKEPDPQYVMTVTLPTEEGTAQERDLPINQVFLLLDEELPWVESRELLSRLERELPAELVGQIPNLALYLLEIENTNSDPSAALDHLDGVIEQVRAYDGVTDASYNHLTVPYAAEPDDDNSALTQQSRCAYSVIDYYQAIPLIDEIRSRVRLHPVKVGIIDSGIDVSGGQFDGIQSRIENLEAPGSDPVESGDGHGTALASIIAADNGDGLTNGIASRVLGTHLSLVVGRSFERTGLHLTLARTESAIGLGARIVNLSFGFGSTDGRRLRGIAQAQQGWARVLRAQASRDVLFVAAAANFAWELRGSNDAPAGLSAANLITVGGIDSCDPMQAWARSAWGSRIDVAAPTGVAFTTVGSAGGAVLGGDAGNSYATAIVTSIAAIVQSIDPSLTGSALKAFLTDPEHVLQTDSRVSGKRVSLLRTVGSAILANTSLASVDTLLDNFGTRANNVPDPPGYCVNRLVGSVSFNVSSLRGYTSPQYVFHGPDIPFTGESFDNLGVLNSEGSAFTLASGSDTAAFGVSVPFRLHHNFPMLAEASLALQASGGGLRTFIGLQVSGNIHYSECELTTRSFPLNWSTDPRAEGEERFVFISVTGWADAEAEGLIDTTPPESAIYRVRADFTTAFWLTGVNSATRAYLEEHCVGGFAYAP